MNISGTWYNELNSQMDLTVSGNQIKGTYWSAVGEAESKYELIGMIDTNPDDEKTKGTAVGWTVVWNNSRKNAHSVTTWSGQYQINEKTKCEEIITIWLLSRETSPQADWSSTLVGQDIFTRNKPSEEAKASRQRMGRPYPV